jgi:hypothetical protein
MTTLFQSMIQDLLKSHNLLETFQSQTEFHVQFDMRGNRRLVVERHSNSIRVAHYSKQNGEQIADPDVELHHPSWTPTAITQSWGYRRERFTTRDGTMLFDMRFHKEVSAFLVMWARDLKTQGWIKKGKVHHDAHA